MSTYCLLALLTLFAAHDQGSATQPLPTARRSPTSTQAPPRKSAPITRQAPMETERFPVRSRRIQSPPLSSWPDSAQLDDETPSRPQTRADGGWSLPDDGWQRPSTGTVRRTRPDDEWR